MKLQTKIPSPSSSFGFLHVSASFLCSDLDMAAPPYHSQHAPPNQTAPWPDRMMMEHYGAHSRSAGPEASGGLVPVEFGVTVCFLAGRRTAFLRRTGWVVVALGLKATQMRGLY